MISMGALESGIPESDLPDIVKRWRASNRKITAMWDEFNDAALKVTEFGGEERSHQCTFRREFNPETQTACMTIQLPSGRKLFYNDPQIRENRWGTPALSYTGVDQTKKWQQINTFGGKLVENCVQAIARDCLAETIENLEAAGLPVVFHVHDEVVIDVKPWADDRTMLDTVIGIMSRPISWAPDLPLTADGWVGEFFKKD